jgi:hypothetical protein
VADPFAPTPLSQIKHRQEIKQQQHRMGQQQQPPLMGVSTSQQQQQQQQQQQVPGPARAAMTPRANPGGLPPGRGGGTGVPAGGGPGVIVAGAAMTQDRVAMEKEIRREKEKFLMFTRVLIKYLEQKDPPMHAQAKLIIKDCAERNKRQEPGYESVTASMKKRLKEKVGEHYWKKANDYLTHFLEQKKKQQLQQQQAGGRGATGPPGGNAGGNSGGPLNMVGARQGPGVLGVSASSASSSRHLQGQQQPQVQLAQQKEQRKRYLEQQKRQAQQDAVTKASNRNIASVTGAATPLANLQEEIHKQREQIMNQGPKPMSRAIDAAATPLSGSTTVPPASAVAAAPAPAAAAPAPVAAAAPTAAATKAAGKKAPRRKSAGPTAASRKSALAGAAGNTATPVATPAPVPKPVVEEPPREYQELMELIDHAVDYSWPSIGQLLGSKADLNLTDEAQQLLYGDSPPPYVSSTLSKKKAGGAASLARTTSGGQLPTSGEDPSDDSDQLVASGIRKGWGRKNILSVRSAWARIRLAEVEAKAGSKAVTAPVVADGLLTMPPPSSSPQQSSTSASGIPMYASSTNSGTMYPIVENGSWVNEEKAEQDKTIALLSEGCQIYLKGILEKAIQCARQRQNLDGIRLWHQQYAASSGGKESSSGKDSSKEKAKDKNVYKRKKPPLSLRLGCDVSRQVAQAQGNAAMTVKRMEEALERQMGVPSRARVLQDETLLEATSMEDLAWRPLLKEGAKKAENDAKRCYEIYGGKEAKEPPLGRVPKKARLAVEDFIMGSNLATGTFHKAYNTSAFISF